MHRCLLGFLAAAAFLAAPNSHAADINIEFDSAKSAGTFSCQSKYPGSKAQALAKGCWKCPDTHPERTLRPDPAHAKACKRPKKQTVVSFSKQIKPKIGLKPCPSDTRLSIDGCVACPRGSKLTTQVLKGKKLARVRCVKTRAAAFEKAEYKGRPGCKKGAFRHRLTDRCYTCPKGMGRSPEVFADPKDSKKACMRIVSNIKAPKIKPPKWLNASAVDWDDLAAEAAAMSELLKILGGATTRYGHALGRGVKPKDYRDETVLAEVAAWNKTRDRIRKRRSRKCDSPPFRVGAVAFGFALDGGVPTPLGVNAGGNATHEYIFSTDGSGDVGHAFSFNLNAGIPAPPGGELSPQVTFYRLPGPELPSWVLSMEGGKSLKAIKNPWIPSGGEISLTSAFYRGTRPKPGLILNTVTNTCSYLLGVTLGLRWLATGWEADIGPVWSPKYNPIN